MELVPEEAADAAKALNKLVPFLGPIRDELEIDAVLGVVIAQPLDQGLALLDLQALPCLLVSEILRVFLLLRVQEKYLSLVLERIPHDISSNSEILIDKHGLEVPLLHRLHGVANTESDHPRVLVDLLEELAYQLFLLHVLYVGERLGSEGDGFIKTVLTAIADV